MPVVTAGSSLLTALAHAARVLPPEADLPLAKGAARIANLLRPGRLAAARANADALFPDLSSAQRRRIAERATIAYLRFLIEYLRSLGLSAEELWERVGFRLDPAIERARSERRGILVCAAHVGNWEVGALALGKLGLDVAVVAGPQYAAAWRTGVRRAKQGRGIEIVHPGGSPRPLMRFLHRGGAVCLLVDGDGFARGRESTLCGRSVRLPEGPARLAGATGALLAGALCTTIAPFRFRVELTALGGTGEAPVRDRERLHAAVTGWLEELLRNRPGHWCIFRDFFAPATPAPISERVPRRARFRPIGRTADFRSATGIR